MKLQLKTEENVQMPDGRWIEYGALKLNGEVAVTFGADYSTLDNVIGKAWNLTREDGKLFVEVEFRDPEKYDEDLFKMFDAYVWAIDLVEEDKRVKHGHIRAINLFARPGFPVNML